MKLFVGIIGVITYNLTSANNHKRQEKSRTASFSLDYSFETLKNSYKELCSFMKSVESLSVCVVSSFRAGRSHHYIPKDTSVFGTEGNISCNKVNIWSQLCVCVSTWMITLEALVQLKWLDTPSAFEAWTNRWRSGPITEVLLKGTWPRILRDCPPLRLFMSVFCNPQSWMWEVRNRNVCERPFYIS